MTSSEGSEGSEGSDRVGAGNGTRFVGPRGNGAAQFGDPSNCRRSALPRRAQDASRLAEQADLQALAYELTVVETRERERIASGLHDEIGQLLTIAKLKLGELGQCAQPSQGPLVDELGSLLTEALRATRSATFDLSCPVLRLGLCEALHSVAQRASGAGLQMQLEGQLPPLAVPEPALTVVFRVVRELTLNVQKHAAASQAWIRPRCDGRTLVVSVVDDGRGFDHSAQRRRFDREGGFGLLSAQAQMQALGGWLELESAPGSGTRASAVLPLPA